MTEDVKLTKEEATKKIQEQLNIAYAAIAEAEKLGIEHDISFSFDVAYGMGGTFMPNPDDYYEMDGAGWLASSHSC